jgi:hypothetical protein
VTNTNLEKIEKARETIKKTIDKNTLVIFLIVWIIISIFIIIKYGDRIQVTCPGNIKCENQFYKCKNMDKSLSTYLPMCHDINKIKCSGDLCEKEYINPGEYIGGYIPWFIKSYSLLTLIYFMIGLFISWRIKCISK